MTEHLQHPPHGPARAYPFGPLAGAGQLLSGRACLLVGWSVIETTGAAVAEVDFIDGQNLTGTPVAFVALTAGLSVRDHFTRPGLGCTAGLFVNVAAGSVQGVAWLAER